MKNNIKTVKSLNQLLQGEHMAVDAFNIYISKTKEEKVKNTFKSVQNQHRNNIKTLANHIQQIGGQPNENIGLKGKVADMKINMDIDSNSGTTHIIKKAIKGLNNGINMAEEVLRGNLDSQSRELTGKILQRDRESIDQLKNLLH